MAHTTRYRKTDTDACDIETINNHFADARESHVGVDETSTTVDNIELKFDEWYHTGVRIMFQKHENMWSGKLEELNTTKHGIDIILGGQKFK